MAEQNQTPDVLRLRLECIECHAKGSAIIDPVQGVRWSFDDKEDEYER